MSSKKTKRLTVRNSIVEFLIFNQPERGKGIEVRYENGTIWLTQKLMADLFSVSVSTINEYLKNIFKFKELKQDSVIRKFRITALDGKNYETMRYNCMAVNREDF